MITTFELANSKQQDEVWDDNRMKRRFLAFEGFNFPSVSGQYSRYPFYWIIIIDDDMPLRYKYRLHNIIGQNKNIYYVYKTAISQQYKLDWIEDIIPKHDSKYFITSRIDNDDAIRNRFIDKIHRWVENNPIEDFRIIYYPNGFIWGPSNISHNYGSVSKRQFMNISAGMSMVCLREKYPITILLGGHNKITKYIIRSKTEDTYLAQLWKKNDRDLDTLKIDKIIRFNDPNMYIWVWHGKNTSHIRNKYPSDQRKYRNSLRHLHKKYTLRWDAIEKLTLPYNK